MLGDLHGKTTGLPQFSLIILKDCFSKLVPKRFRKKWIRFTNMGFVCICILFIVIIYLSIFRTSTNTKSISNMMSKLFKHADDDQHSPKTKAKAASLTLPFSEFPPPVIKSQDSQRPSIYISIATLGDYGCPQTVNSAFTQAKYPSLIYMGIYQQNDATDPDCLQMLQQCEHMPNADANANANVNKEESESKSKSKSNGNADADKHDVPDEKSFDIGLLCEMHKTKHILINRTTIVDGAKGPVYGRHMALKMLADQDFILIIDSHSIFRIEWDVVLVDMYESINNEYAVLSHYPWGAEHLHKRIRNIENEHSYHLCGTYFEGPPNHIPRNANGCFVKNAVGPVLVPFFAGGFSFAKAHFTAAVPWDPYLLHIFNGEEFNIATRGWTHGYDFYSPTFDIVGHWYDRGPKRKSPHLQQYIADANRLRLKSEKRILSLWGLLSAAQTQALLANDEIELREIAKYSLGQKRTLAEYWKFAGIDIHNRTVTIFSTDLYQKGGLTYVPWTHP